MVQGIAYCRGKSPQGGIGLTHWEIGGCRPCGIEGVAAFDIGVRKVGKHVSEAIFEPPNCTPVFCEDFPKVAVRVRMGCILDGVAGLMQDPPEPRPFLPSDERWLHPEGSAPCETDPRAYPPARWHSDASSAKIPPTGPIPPGGSSHEGRGHATRPTPPEEPIHEDSSAPGPHHR